MEPFSLDDIDFRDIEPSARVAIAGTICPRLLRRIHEAGLTVAIENSTQALEEYHSARTDGGSLYALLRPDRWLANRGDGLSLFLLDARRPVGAVGSALLWSESSLAESLARWDPTARATAREAWEIRAAHVAYSGGGHLQPEYRRRGAYKALFHLLLVMLLTRWRWSHHFSLIREHTNVDQRWDPLALTIHTYGFDSIQPSVHLGSTPTLLVTSRRAEVWRHVLELAE